MRSSVFSARELVHSIAWDIYQSSPRATSFPRVLQTIQTDEVLQAAEALLVAVRSALKTDGKGGYYDGV